MPRTLTPACSPLRQTLHWTMRLSTTCRLSPSISVAGEAVHWGHLAVTGPRHLCHLRPSWEWRWEGRWPGARFCDDVTVTLAPKSSHGGRWVASSAGRVARRHMGRGARVWEAVERTKLFPTLGALVSESSDRYLGN